MMRKPIFAALLALALLLGAAAAAEGDHSQVAEAADMTDVVDVVREGMVPVGADALNDGVYEVAVDCSSSMFKIVRCELSVAEGTMTAKLYMKSDAYAWLFPGTAEAAARAGESELLSLNAEGDDRFFLFPVPALDAGVDCAAFSSRKQLWYPRTLLFRSDSLPEAAWNEAGRVTAQTLGLADGVYTVEAAMEGGRTTLQSPATLYVEAGVCTAQVVFSTEKIGYVTMDGVQYAPVEGQSAACYRLPVAFFDRWLPIVLNSTAIKPATDVDYTLRFDSATIAPAE